jgi:hypothetical protein
MSVNDEYHSADALNPAVTGDPTLPSLDAFEPSTPLSRQHHAAMRTIADRLGLSGLRDFSTLSQDGWDLGQWAVKQITGRATERLYGCFG